MQHQPQPQEQLTRAAAAAAAADQSATPTAKAVERSSGTSWSRAFDRVGAHEKPPDPPESLRAWTSHTMYGLMGGSLLGGYNGLRLARTDAPSPIPHNNAAHRAALFFVRESVLTSARFGAFTSMLSAFAIVAADGLRVPAPADYAAAAAATCALFAAARGGLRAAAPAAGFGVVAGAAAGLARNALQDAMDWCAPPQTRDALAERVAERVARAESERVCDDGDSVDGGELVSRVISRFETTLPNFARGAALPGGADGARGDDGGAGADGSETERGDGDAVR